VSAEGARGGGRRLVIAVDGPAGAGKSTAARGLAARLGYRYVDSGAMYRVVGLAARERGVDPADAAALGALVDGIDFGVRDEPGGQRILLGGRDVTEAIREPAIGEWASRVAAVGAVRDRLVARQRACGAGGGVVMDGRDIGTVVFPDADCKFFLTASVEERARRREGDAAGGGAPDREATRAAIEERDRRDRQRERSPLRPAPDAMVVDTTDLSPDEVLARLLAAAVARGASP
jgi:cytidylate kinase